MPTFDQDVLPENSLQFYNFVGTILGLAVHHGMLVDVQFIPAFFIVCIDLISDYLHMTSPSCYWDSRLNWAICKRLTRYCIPAYHTYSHMIQVSWT